MDLYYINCENFEGDKQNKKQHNAGRYIVEYVAKNILKLENSEIIIENKKPKFKYSDIKFSISHSDCWVVVAFSKNEIGVDIEKIKQRDYKALAERMNFELKEDSLSDFYRCWTIYEAEYKLQQKAKSVKTIDFKNEYKISIASVDLIDEINLIEIFLNCHAYARND